MEKIKENRIIIVGDLFPVPSNFSKFKDGNISYLFGEKICNLFNAADYRICNLEGALTDRPGFCEKTGPVLYAPTTTINAYKSLGIDCCTLANNHITDAGVDGVLDTLKTLDSARINHLGAGDNEDSIRHYHNFSVDKYCICLYNVGETMYNIPAKTQPGAFLYDEYIVCKEIEVLKKKCDYLIVVYHGGAEKYRYPTPQIRKRFHRMVDCGANMILSQHTHCVGSEEYYKGAYLLYGQGNFLFRSFNNEFTDTGLIIELLISEGRFFVKKHLVDAVGDTVRYDENQNFKDFDERSKKLLDEAFLEEEFKKYCLDEAYIYLKSFKGTFPLQGLMVRYFPKIYKKYVLNNYRREQLLFTLHSLRSEQNREIAIEGIKELLKKRKYK